MRVKVRWSRAESDGAGPIAAVLREFAALLRIGGVLKPRPYATFLFVFATVVFGILIPWRRSLDFYDPVLMCAYSIAAVFLSGPAATDLVGSDWDSARTVIARVFASALFSAAFFGWLIGVGIVTVNIEIRPGVAWPPGPVVGATLAFNAAASLFMAAVGALIAVVLTPVAAKLIVRAGMLVALFGILLIPRLLPPDAQAVLAVNLAQPALTRFAFIAAAILGAVAIGPIGALRGARR